MPRAKLLIVDDDGDFLGELKESLVMDGYDVAAFSDGGAALKAARAFKPDLAMVDLKMRGKSGFQVALELRRGEETKEIPIIGMTGFFTKAEHGELMTKSGIDRCLVKPFALAALAHALTSLLGRGKGNR